VIGSGTISNRAAVDAQGQKTWPLGYSCIAEQRAIETILHGVPITDYMKFNDTIKIEMLGTDGLSIFGAIDQVVKPLQSPHV
jgi:fumarylacetoacetate (FAA) hydrolase